MNYLMLEIEEVLIMCAEQAPTVERASDSQLATLARCIYDLGKRTAALEIKGIVQAFPYKLTKLRAYDLIKAYQL